jgi:hypothetical protein
MTLSLVQADPTAWLDDNVSVESHRIDGTYRVLVDNDDHECVWASPYVEWDDAVLLARAIQRGKVRIL